MKRKSRTFSSPVIFRTLRTATKSIRATAREIGVGHADLFNFLKGRRYKVSKKNQKTIHKYLVEIGILSAPKPRPRCQCPTCGKEHAQRKTTASNVQS